MEHGIWMRRDPQSSSIPTPRLNQDIETLNPLCHTGGIYYRNGVMEYPRYPISEMHLGKFRDFWNFNVGKSTSRMQHVQNRRSPHRCALDHGS